MGKILDGNGQRKYETNRISLEISSTTLSLEEITRIKKDLVSSLPESLKLEVLEASQGKRKVSTSETLSSVKLVLVTF